MIEQENHLTKSKCAVSSTHFHVEADIYHALPNKQGT